MNSVYTACLNGQKKYNVEKKNSAIANGVEYEVKFSPKSA